MVLWWADLRWTGALKCHKIGESIGSTRIGAGCERIMGCSTGKMCFWGCMVQTRGSVGINGSDLVPTSLSR